MNYLIVGASISTYLPETIRVTSRTLGERNYHVFYELAAGLSEEIKKELNFKPLAFYRVKMVKVMKIIAVIF